MLRTSLVLLSLTLSSLIRHHLSLSLLLFLILLLHFDAAFDDDGFDEVGGDFVRVDRRLNWSVDVDVRGADVGRSIIEDCESRLELDEVDEQDGNDVGEGNGIEDDCGSSRCLESFTGSLGCSVLDASGIESSFDSAFTRGPAVRGGAGLTPSTSKAALERESLFLNAYGVEYGEQTICLLNAIFIGLASGCFADNSLFIHLDNGHCDDFLCVR